MKIFRRCLRYRLSRLGIYLMILYLTSFTGAFIYNFDWNTFSEEQLGTKDIQSLDEDNFNTTDLTCQQPKLMIENPEIWEHLDPVRKSQPDCEKSTNWVYVDNGTFRLSEQALQKHGPILCGYRSILRSKDDFSTIEGVRLFPVVDKMALLSNFFHADCRGHDGTFYSNIHSGIMYHDHLHMRHILNPMIKTQLGYNVLMFGFDSVSRMTFMRFLPKTYTYLIKELGGIVFKGYNIVGDGTPAALLPILTGKTELELPEARRGHAGAESVDRFPWIWKKFKDNGYITQWTEDFQSHGTFQFRLKGFDEEPVDYYDRPFYLVAESLRTSKPLCFGSITRFQSMLNWIRYLFEMYPNAPKFSFAFHNQYSHNSNNRLPYADDELVEFLKLMNNRGYFDNTIFILMSDHGARFSSLRKTYQGKLEERLPFLSIRMPKKFQDNYPNLMYNLRLNSHRLTTPFDLHETFEHLFEFHSPNRYQSKSNRSYSLFQLIPQYRTCSQANVEEHWCACLNWNIIPIHEPIIQQLGKQSVEFLNNFISDYKNECVSLSLYRIDKANQLSANEHLLKFVNSKDKDGRLPRFRNNALESNQIKTYQIQFQTIPGYALFELSAQYNPLNDTFIIRKEGLSRIDKYGETSDCIMYKRPEFREICYCSSLLNRTYNS
ncbi:unnamed protein product [Rotaria sp. Silwood1]|nr:unnamed protein product [Rotaria sp. Silwood1]CAF1638470.1 unnamed protein product [Rotaria sp. Silwood1]CAF3758515.1 unnamed protein product [Rotaria sp. Silwood1]CAF3778621.1 unnamed protein product [Rotaria sp. Silwood1]CAF4620751.1 unnamed protein product [Rotaria sp. Silwood1]